jgi:hypothetical protein
MSTECVESMEERGSKRLTISLDEGLIELGKLRAKREHRSLSSHIAFLIERDAEQQESAKLAEAKTN